MWWVPVLVFLLCFGGGVAAASRWLPELAEGPVGGFAFFVVCGLLGAAVALVGLHIYLIVRQLELDRLGSSFDNSATTLASGLTSFMFEAGFAVGLGAIVYLLAPGSRPRT
jgi:hypothetical protein